MATCNPLRPNGVFVVSLDLELHWGMTDITALSESYSAQLRRTRERVIPRLLALFDEYGIHATWATVGLLFCEDRRQLESSLPAERPAYVNDELSAYQHLDGVGFDESDDPYHFASSIVRRIRESANQEIGSHSFAHYYTLESGHRAEAFEADLEAWADVAAHHEVEARSICFPRNQYEPSTLEMCVEAGLDAYRGNEPAWCYRARPVSSDGLVRKIARRLDAYLPLTPHHHPTVTEIAEHHPYNIASSRFFRSHHGALRALEPLKQRRILNGMTHAAENNGVYHLWWHPQDFGVDTEENFAALVRVLETYRELSDRHGMVSRSMGELAAMCDSLRAPMPVGNAS